MGAERPDARRQPLPLLRPPPFPALNGDLLSDPAAVECDESRLVDVAARMVAARVGGSFWAARPDLRGVSRVVVGDAEAHDGPNTLVLRGEFDPWAVIDAGVEVIAPEHHEVVVLGGMLLKESGLKRTYRSPFTGEPISVEAFIDLLALWRREIDFNLGVAGVAGMAFWKREAVDRFLWVPGRESLPDVKARDIGRVKGAVIVWPSRAPEGLQAAAEAASVPVIAMEDGFIRSVGLGSDCHAPLSVVLDAQGMYFDATGPSDLETILQTHAFPPELIARAEALAAAVVAANITKYGAGSAAFDAGAPPGRRVVLACGQVEDDLSVRLGGAGVAGNLDLLRRVRAAEPDAFILFKPHPDVDAGHRKGRIDDADALAIVDRVVRGQPMPALFDAVDAVHVLTSLAGFEALLRGREVVTHGHPFYAGWGLTRDMAGPVARRTRGLTLAQLVAGTLILYPRYLDPDTGLPCPPEILVDRFAHQVAPRETWVTRARRLQSRLRTAFLQKGRAA
jgi:capsular polysaccharide export protein